MRDDDEGEEKDGGQEHDEGPSSAQGRGTLVTPLGQQRHSHHVQERGCGKTRSCEVGVTARNGKDAKTGRTGMGV